MVTFDNWGDYFWPGQLDHCRRNLLGIHDPDELERVERKATFARSLQLHRGEVQVPQTFDLDHLRAIHRHLFCEVYEWAGEFRATELVRPSADPNAPAHEFVGPDQIEALAPMIFRALGDPTLLVTATRQDQVDNLRRPTQRSTCCTRSSRATGGPDESSWSTSPAPPV